MTDSHQAVKHLSQDPILAKVIERTELQATGTNIGVYPALLRSIVSQQLSVKAAATIHKRFLRLFDGQQPEPEQVLALDLEALRGVGLSRQKSNYVQNVAHFFSGQPRENTFWQELENEEILQRLTSIKGVGKWTVQMILMFTLHRPDIFPIDDLGIRQAMIRLYNVKEEGRALKPRLETIAKPWSPHRTLACRYLWSFKDNEPVAG